jgi:hypothetical protein
MNPADGRTYTRGVARVAKLRREYGDDQLATIVLRVVQGELDMLLHDRSEGTLDADRESEGIAEALGMLDAYQGVAQPPIDLGLRRTPA